MAKRSWTLTDLDQGLHVDQLGIGPEEVEGAAEGYLVNKGTLHGGLRDGVDVIEIDNGAFRFIVVPTRGMGIWRAMYGDETIGWQSPVRGPVHPGFVRLWEPSGIGWLDGFDELICRCGLENNGAPEFDETGKLLWGLHGRIANIPAHRVTLEIDGDTGEIALTGEVDEARLFGNKLRLRSTFTTRPGQPGLTITDTVTNISAEPSEMELLYHCNFGVPLLAPGAKAVLPVRKVAPRDAVAQADVDHWDIYDPETPGSTESVFFFELAAGDDGGTQTLVRNAAGDRGVSLQFNTQQLPCFILWKNRQAEADGYVTGMEPAINFPNVRSFEEEQGRVAVLEPGESRHFEITLQYHADAAAVEAAEAEVARLQQGVEPEVLGAPDPKWSAG